MGGKQTRKLFREELAACLVYVAQDINPRPSTSDRGWPRSAEVPPLTGLK